jgi:methionine synthase reductase
VLFASQTGTAEWIARHIREEAELRHGFPASVASCDEFVLGKSSVSLDNNYGGDERPLLLLVASTTGDGDVPDNSTKFYRFLKRDPKKSLLNGQEYLLLGLGDTNYDVFCGGAKRLDREMVKLGMKCVGERGWADEATG